jgi:hypothetical protein
MRQKKRQAVPNTRPLRILGRAALLSVPGRTDRRSTGRHHGIFNGECHNRQKDDAYHAARIDRDQGDGGQKYSELEHALSLPGKLLSVYFLSSASGLACWFEIERKSARSSIRLLLTAASKAPAGCARLLRRTARNRAVRCLGESRWFVEHCYLSQIHRGRLTVSPPAAVRHKQLEESQGARRGPQPIQLLFSAVTQDGGSSQENPVHRG